MALTPKSAFIDDFTTLADKPNKTASEMKALFESQPGEMLTYINDTQIKEITEGAYNYGVSIVGTDAYAVTITNVTVLVAGAEFFFKADVANTGAATLLINALTVTAIKKNSAVALENGDIPAGGIAHVKYDGTNYQLLNPQAIAKSILTAQGDTIYASGAGAPAKLTKGTAGQVLEMNPGATVPQWGNIALGLHQADTVQLATIHGLRIESGTWTPVLAGGATAGVNTYTTQTGTYYKIGKMIVSTFTIVLSAKDAAMAGGLLISGLPFVTSGEFSPVFNRIEGITIGTSYSGLAGYSSVNAIILIQVKGTWDALLPADISAIAKFRGSLTYITT
jgi:hypothetical protein